MRNTKAPVGRPLRPVGKRLQEDSRRHHRALLLQHLFQDGAASRADLARSSGLTRVTVSDLVAEMLADGFVEELDTPIEGRIGKPPTMVDVAPDSHHILCVDLSPVDQINGAVINLKGDIVARDSLAVGGLCGDAAVGLVIELVRRLDQLTESPILGVGIGSPGVVDADGVVLNAPNLGWRDVALAEEIRGQLGLSVFVANDANAAVLGEYTFGEAAEGGLMLLRIANGVGAGLILEGTLVHGHRSAAGEIGHVVVDDNGTECACGRRGCLETALSVPSLRRRVAGLDDESREQSLAVLGSVLGGVLAPIVGALNLQEVVLCGPRELLDGALRATTEATIRARTMAVSGEDFVVRTSRLDDDVVLIGAAVLVLAAQLGVS